MIPHDRPHPPMTREYRVVWRRLGMAAHKSKCHVTHEAAERHVRLLALRDLGWPLLVESSIEYREVGPWTEVPE